MASEWISSLLASEVFQSWRSTAYRKELRQLIREMSTDNPLWGAPRIHGELLKLGFDVCQSTVAKYMVKDIKPPSQSWKTFLKNHADGIAAVDLLVVPSLSFKLLYCFVVIHHKTRRLLHFGVTQHPTSDWIAQQIKEAFPWDEAPEYLIRDNDAIYGNSFTRCLQSMGIRDRPTSFKSPWQNAYVERVIVSIRRECLDHVIVLGEDHLRLEELCRPLQLISKALLVEQRLASFETNSAQWTHQVIACSRRIASYLQ